MPIIRVVGANLDTERLTLYKEDGSTFEISQGDPRLREILKSLEVITHPGQVAIIELGGDEDTNHYKAFEEKASGLVRLFRVAKKVVQHIFAEPIEPKKIGITTGKDLTRQQILETTSEQELPKATPFAKAVDEIISQAEPVSAEGYDHNREMGDDTIIAVVENSNGSKTVIPEAEKLKGQFANSAKLGNTVGVENLLKRLSAVIDKRAHSVQDVLTFIERADLPIANDGSIIAYKVLKTRNDRERHDRIFVDCHTGKVTQRVGSYVMMDETMVDHNRRQECSNGLHIARRGYLRAFSGDVIVITKVAPEDVIAVPHGDPNKVRVCGYHILGEIPQDQHAELRSHRPMTNNERAAKLLSAVINGDHIGRLEEVRITEGHGGGVVITPLVEGKKAERVEKAQANASIKKAEPAKAINIDDPKAPKNTDKPVDPKKVAEKVADTKSQPETRQAKARRLFMAKDTQGLLDLKKVSKVGWDKLGINDAEFQLIQSDFAGVDPMKPEVQAQREPKGKPPVRTKKTGTIAETMKELNSPEKAFEKAVMAKASPNISAEPTQAVGNNREIPKMDGNRQKIARALWDKAVGGDKAAWGHLWLHKKQSKQGWDKLGFNTKEIERIQTNKPDWI